MLKTIYIDVKLSARERDSIKRIAGSNVKVFSEARLEVKVQVYEAKPKPDSSVVAEPKQAGANSHQQEVVAKVS